MKKNTYDQVKGAFIKKKYLEQLTTKKSGNHKTCYDVIIRSKFVYEK